MQQFIALAVRGHSGQAGQRRVRGDVPLGARPFGEVGGVLVGHGRHLGEAALAQRAQMQFPDKAKSENTYLHHCRASFLDVDPVSRSVQ